MEGVSLISLKAYNDIFLFVKNLKYIVVDIKSIDRYLLAFDVPIFIYLPKEITIDSLELDIPKKCIYIFSNFQELDDILKKLKIKDNKETNREAAIQYLLGREETLNNSFVKYLTNILY